MVFHCCYLLLVVLGDCVVMLLLLALAWIYGSRMCFDNKACVGVSSFLIVGVIELGCY